MEVGQTTDGLAKGQAQVGIEPSLAASNNLTSHFNFSVQETLHQLGKGI